MTPTDWEYFWLNAYIRYSSESRWHKAIHHKQSYVVGRLQKYWTNAERLKWIDFNYKPTERDREIAERLNETLHH